MMFKRKLSFLLIMVCILNSLLFLAPSYAAVTIHVGQKPGMGYNYVGTTSAVIQQAVTAAGTNDTIYIHEGEYEMLAPINLKSNIIIQGEGINKTILHGADGVCDGTDGAYLSCVGVSDTNKLQNIDISGITFKSDSLNRSGENGDADRYRYCIFVKYCTDVRVHNCHSAKYIYNDFFRAEHSDNLKMYDCHVVTGHCAAYLSYCKHCEVYNNRILTYINAGIRGYSTPKDDQGHHNLYHHNTIWCEKGGQAGFEFQMNCDGTDIYSNIIYDFNNATDYWCVVQDWADSTTGTLTVSDNVWWNSRGGIEKGDNGTNRNQTTGGIQDVTYWKNQGYGSNLADLAFPEPNPWWSGINFTSQQNLGTGNTGTAVNLEFDLIPLSSTTARYVGYADSSVTIDSYSDMAMILKMYSGYFYAMNGSSYAKSANVTYSTNTSYHIRILANMSAKTYDVFITPSGGSQTQIANDYAFTTGAPTTDDVGKVCLNSDTTSDDFMIENHTVITGASSQVTFNPSADSYVRGGSEASCNFGTCTDLTVKYDTDSSNTYYRKSYLKFNYSSLSGSTVSNARLRVYLSATDGDASLVKVYGNSTESWTETGITWNNAPAASTYIANVHVPDTAGRWCEIDVTGYVNSNMSDKLISLELINEGPFTDGNKASFNSREASSNKPQLVITP